MVFSSLQFIGIFMPIFFTVYYGVPKEFKNLVLLFGSLAFYFVGAWKHPEHFAIFLISILLDFWMAYWMERKKHLKKLFLGIGIAFHLLSLIFFKYTNFLAAECGKLLQLDLHFEILLPIGISFYTFQGLSYLFDVYRGKIKAEKSLLHYAVYIAMFEQLIAGPIVTYSQIQKELYRREITKKSALEGMQIFVFGVVLKVLLANPLGKLFTQTQNIGFESISTPFAWLAIVAFSLQIYLDFFGYSLMAIGLGQMMGFHIPKNFDHPYRSICMTEFWRRWHISLGSWFREYVYIPLGGNQKGMARTILNLAIVWLLTGVWHGAGYNFLLWGAVLFLIITLEKLFLQKFLEKHRWLGHFYMLLLIPISWAIFAIEDMGQLGIFLCKLFPFLQIQETVVFYGDFLKYLKLYWPFLLIGILFCTRYPYEILKKIKNPYILHTILGILFAGSLYCMYRGFDDPFLYFRF